MEGQMKRIGRDQTMSQFDGTLVPNVEIAPGEQLLVEAFLMAKPATGPIGVKGAEPGDTLVVTIHDIKIVETNYWFFLNDRAAFRTAGFPYFEELGKHLAGAPRKVHDRFGEAVHLTIPIEGNYLVFSERLRVPLRPVIGVIGVAPEGEPIPTNWSGRHGGNMDCREVGIGAKVYFPVNARGALLGLGDTHAAQHDGELLPAVECKSDVLLSVEVRKGLSLPMVFVESDEAFHCIGSGKTLDEATADAINGMIQVLRDHAGLNYVESCQLIAAWGDARICQVVNPVLNMRISLAKKALPGLRL
jgi:amidase